jgi:hypothetical protein
MVWYKEGLLILMHFIGFCSPSPPSVENVKEICEILRNTETCEAESKQLTLLFFRPPYFAERSLCYIAHFL